jgi:hypothetical protein
MCATQVEWHSDGGLRWSYALDSSEGRAGRRCIAGHRNEKIIDCGTGKRSAWLPGKGSTIGGEMRNSSTSVLGRYPSRCLQVLTLWALQKGVVVVTTGSQAVRIADSLAAAEAARPSEGGAGPLQPLSEEDICRIDEAGSRLTYRKYWQKEFGLEQDWKRPAHSLT